MNLPTSNPPQCPSVQLIANEQAYLPVLADELNLYWPDATLKASFAAQVRQETCPSLKSKKCWNPHAELNTDREKGIGLGQLTITSRFDNFKEAKKLDSSLSKWKWENRYNAAFQLRTLVLMDRFNFGKFKWAESMWDHVAFMFVAYNGGVGGVLSDRAVCRATPGCNPDKWWGNVEHTSKKAKVAANGYGQSFFQINRTYPKNIMVSYLARYQPYFKECPSAK